MACPTFSKGACNVSCTMPATNMAPITAAKTIADQSKSLAKIRLEASVERRCVCIIWYPLARGSARRSPVEPWTVTKEGEVKAAALMVFCEYIPQESARDQITRPTTIALRCRTSMKVLRIGGSSHRSIMPRDDTLQMTISRQPSSASIRADRYITVRSSRCLVDLIRTTITAQHLLELSVYIGNSP